MQCLVKVNMMKESKANSLPNLDNHNISALRRLLIRVFMTRKYQDTETDNMMIRQ